MSNRRIYPRRRVTFPATYTVDGETTQPAYGLDFGGGGLQLLTREPLTERGAILLTVMLDGRRLRFHAVRAWTGSLNSHDGPRYRHGMRLKTMADRDWDYLMQLLVKDTRNSRGSVLTPTARDTLFSAEKQHQIAAALAEAGRLTYSRGQRLPLIEYAFEGYTMRKGTRYYALNVRSRVMDGNVTSDYHTRLLAAIEGEGVVILE